MSSTRQKIIEAAIIGCGKVAGGYDNPSALKGKEALTHAGAYHLHPRTELVACCDIDKGRLDGFSKKWNVALKFLDVDKFFSYVSENVDILTIATPDEEHYAMVKRAIGANLPVVICEKPLALDLDRCKEIIELCQKSRTRLTVNLIRRWADNIKALKKNLESGLIGDIKLVNAFYKGGIVHNGIHLIDMFQMFFSHMCNFEVRQAGYLKDNNDLSVSFDFLFDGDARGTVHGVNFGDFDIFEIDIMGTEGRLKISDFTHNITLFKKGKSRIYNDDIELLEVPYNHLTNFKTAFYNLVDEAVNCAEKEIAFSYTITEIKKSMEAVLYIRQEARKRLVIEEQICRKN